MFKSCSGRNRIWQSAVVLLLLVVPLIFCAACGSDNSDSSLVSSACNTETTTTPHTTPPTTPPTTILAELGEVVTLGEYRTQSDRIEPIEWRVINVDRSENKALLLAEKGLDCHVFSEKLSNQNWGDSDIRRWLNDSFLNTAFSAAEAEQIRLEELENESYNGLQYITEDRVFCLSVQEANDYLNKETMKLSPTPYAVDRGVLIDGGVCCWWLRSAGDENCACIVNFNGVVAKQGNRVSFKSRAVRPAIYVTINEDSYICISE